MSDDVLLASNYINIRQCVETIQEGPKLKLLSKQIVRGATPLNEVR